MSFFWTLHARWNQLIRLAAPIFPRIGLGLMAVAALLALHSWIGTLGFVHTDAIVTQNLATQNPDGTVLYTSELRFRLPSNAFITFADPVRSNDPDNPDFSAAAVVPVLYPAANPQGAHVATVGRLYRGAITFGLLGIVIFDIGIFFRMRLKRNKTGLLSTPEKLEELRNSFNRKRRSPEK